MNYKDLIKQNSAVINQKDFFLKAEFFNITDEDRNNIMNAGFILKSEADTDFYGIRSIWILDETQYNDNPFESPDKLEELMSTGRYEIVKVYGSEVLRLKG